MHDVTRQNSAARNENFVYAFVDVDVVSGNDAFDVQLCKPTPFCITGLLMHEKEIPMIPIIVYVCSRTRTHSLLPDADTLIVPRVRIRFFFSSIYYVIMGSRK